MQRHIYKALLFLLRALVYLKRAVFWVLGVLWEAWQALSEVYSRTLGFRIYKVWFLCKKQLVKWKIPLDSRLLEMLGRRGTLQIVLFLVGISLMFPYTRLYTQELGGTVGEGTVLFSLVGPGDGYYELEEIEVDVTELQTRDSRTWRQGAVSTDAVAPGAATQPGFTNDALSSISAGGSAVTKPTIITGVDQPPAPIPIAGTGPRTKIIEYVVKPGDVIGRIAESFAISVETILWANNLSIRSYIRPGDKLKILPQTGVLHKVKRGDTISKIARTYDTDTEKIIRANKLQAGGSDIVVGEELIIPDGRKPYVAPVRRTTKTSQSFRSISAPPPSVNAPAGSGYLWPTSVRRITQYFGWRHTGLDIGGPVGTPLYASRSGRVIKSQCGWNGGYGCYIILDHGGGVHTLYAHNSQLYVSVGEQVVQGQTIAAMGSTGRSTGPHIHFEVRVNGRRQNPLKYIK